MNDHFGSADDSKHRPDVHNKKVPVGKIYRQFYRKAWEEIPEFKEWLTSIPGERSKAYCKICERSLHAHRLSLTKHTVSLKHMRLAQQKAQAQQKNLSLSECYEGESGDDVSSQVEIGQPTYSVISSRHALMKPVNDDYSGEVVSSEVIVPTHLNENDLNELRAAQQQEEEDEESEEMVIAASGDEGGCTQIIIYEAEEHRMSSSASGGDPEGDNHLSLVELVQHKKRTMEKSGGQVTTHVIDISKGMPVAGLAVSLYQLLDGRWILLSEGSTNGDGRWGEGSNVGLKPGRYKLHYDTERYFLLRHQPTFYPFVEVVFDMCSPNDRYHLPLILGPHGFTTYKGC